MQKEFKRFISSHIFISPGTKILLANSGGLDSMVLFDLLLKAEISFSVAHCNFGLRGKESDGDSKFVKEQCKKHKIEFFSKKFNTAAVATFKGISIQMAARELRYEWFEKVRHEHHFDYVATAHHKSDVAETLLINLLRGSGIAGLHGIAAVNGTLVRPLLCATRNEIEQYAKLHTIAYREDSSNAQDDYLRNKLRHLVIPQLKKINPQMEQTFFETSQKIAAAELIFNESIEAKGKALVQKKGKQILLSITQLKKLKPLSIYLYEFFKKYNFSASTCSEIEAALGKKSGNQFFSPTHRLLIDRQTILISEIETQTIQEKYSIDVDEKEIHKPIHLRIKKSKITKNFILQKQKNKAQIDASKLHFPLELRRWRVGDSFQPIGMKGKKKLSDFFIDSKVSIFEKEKIWLLCSGKDIVWIMNYRIDEKYKITASTKNIIQFEYLEERA